MWLDTALNTEKQSSEELTNQDWFYIFILTLTQLHIQNNYLFTLYRQMYKHIPLGYFTYLGGVWVSRFLRCVFCSFFFFSLDVHLALFIVHEQ